MSEFNVLNETPFIGTIDNFLSVEECNALIEFGKIKSVPSEVYADNGTAIVDVKERNSETTYTSKENGDIDKLIDLIYTRVATTIGMDKNRFENFQVTHYKPDMHLSTHWDYFIEKEYNPTYTESIRNMCSKGGGNRVSTVLLYLNDTEEGGETYFPWQKIAIKPTQGKLAYFKYNYDDPMSNIQSAHTSMPVVSGIKWIITIIVAEAPLDQPMPNFNKFSAEGNIITSLHDTCYELECGPEEDRRTLSISLPANDDPSNTIVIGFTAGMDSSLLLFLLGMLNSHQVVPYVILPIAVDTYQVLPENENGLGEDYRVIPLMVKLIQSRLKNKGGILDFTYGTSRENPDSEFFHVVPSHVKRKQALFGMLDYFKHKQSRFRKHKFLYMGTIEPPGEECAGTNNLSVVNINIVKTPLTNLKKYHIIDAILQLGLEDVLKLCTASTPDNHTHTNLTETCNVVACMERRWAFTKLLGLEQMGMDYFVNKFTADGINIYEAEVVKKLN